MEEKLYVKIFGSVGDAPYSKGDGLNSFLESLAQKGAKDISVEALVVTSFPKRYYSGKELESVPAQNYDILVKYRI